MEGEYPDDAAADERLRIDVRAAVPTDAPSIADVWLCAHEGTRDDAIVGIRGELELAARGAGRVVLVATSAERIVGYGRAREYTSSDTAGYRNCPAGWWLSGSLVVPESRRRGVARTLVHARLACLPGAVHSRVDVSNAASRALHEQCGFREVTRDFQAPGSHRNSEPMILFRATDTGNP